MRTAIPNLNAPLGAAVVLALLALLAGCGKPVPAPDLPEPVVAPPPAAAAEAVPDASADPAPVSDNLPAAPPQEKLVATEPAIATMKVAQASSKLSVPVELRYQFDGPVRAGQPVTLHLAAVPRVEGSNLAVSIKDSPDVATSAGELRAQKATVASVYRRQLSVTRLTEGAGELRVLITMDMPVGSAFGWVSVPFE
jgi:hypothetical protein